MKVSFSTCFTTLRKCMEYDHSDNSKDNVGVVFFRKNGRPHSIQYFEYHAGMPRLWKTY